MGSEMCIRDRYLIGDPKQSIYRFRGADIGMYLRARDSANGKHSLDRNWRSSTQLINALNTLYAQSSQPFGTVDIHYQTVTAGGAAEDKALTVADEALPPLQFDWCEVSEDKLPNIDVSVAVLATACACLLYTSPSPRDGLLSRMPSSA